MAELPDDLARLTDADWQRLVDAVFGTLKQQQQPPHERPRHRQQRVQGSSRGCSEESCIEAVARELFASMQQSFTAKAWEWPGTTERRVGTVGSPRNLIDVGNLRQSGSYRMVGPYRAEFRWSANYATAVHEGYRRFRADGSASSWPARPWTDAVLGRVRVPGIEPFPLNKRFREVWLQRFKGRR